MNFMILYRRQVPCLMLQLLQEHVQHAAPCHLWVTCCCREGPCTYRVTVHCVARVSMFQCARSEAQAGAASAN